MTDQELSSLGERLYGAIIAARLSDPALEDLASAISTRRPWMALAERTKIAVFVVATQMSAPEDATDRPRLDDPAHPPPSVDSAPDESAQPAEARPAGTEAPTDDGPNQHDVFADATGEFLQVDVPSIRHEAPAADTAMAAPAAEPLANAIPGVSDDATEGDDERDGEDTESSASRVVGRSRRKSSS